MAHSFRALQHWNNWLSQQYLGGQILQAEKDLLSQLLQQHFGKQALLIGVTHQYELLNASTIPFLSLLTPLISHENKVESVNFIEGSIFDLPIATAGVDLVLLPHTLEFVDNPNQVIAEACRVIRPEGLIVVCGFNPYSVWGMKKYMYKNKNAPWHGNFLTPRKIRSWLNLADFKIEKQQSILFRPPTRNSVYEKLEFVEQIGKVLFPTFGALYVVVARAKVIPLTPIKLKWKQQWRSIRISTISGNIARQSK